MNVRTSLDRLLCLFAPVEAGEGLTALLLMMNLFLLMSPEAGPLLDDSANTDA